MAKLVWAMIDVRNLVKSFGSRVALAGVDLSVAAGEFVTLVGPNGAGKTTFLRVLATLARPTSGTVRIAGLNLARAGEEVRRRIGFLSHRTLLYEDLTAEQNLRFYARMYDLSDGPDRIMNLLGRMGLTARRHDLVRTFSRGMQQRLAVVRAVLHRPQVLLLDEPYTGLDLNAVQVLTDFLTELAGEGCTILLTTHNLERGLVVGRRVVVLARGRLVYDERREAIPPTTFPETCVSREGPDPYPDLTGLTGHFSAGICPRIRPSGDQVESSSKWHLWKPVRPPRVLVAALTARVCRAIGILSYLRKVWAIVLKDIAAELHTREMVSAMLVFSVLVLLVFSFALDLRGAMARAAAPGVLWATVVFAGTLGLSCSLAREQQTRQPVGACIDGLILAPVDRSAIFFGKALGNLAFMAVVEVILLPLFAALFDVPLLVGGGVLIVMVLGTVGYAAVGTLLAAIAMNTRTREVMLPILLLPLAIPALIAAVQAIGGLVEGATLAEVGGWVRLLVVYDLIIVAVSMLTFGYIVEE